MLTRRNKVSSREVSSEIDLSEYDIPKEIRDEVHEAVAEYLREQILISVADQVSPVTGRGFKRLSKNYAKLKLDETGSTDANLDLTGSMLQSLDVTTTRRGLVIGVFGADAPKADGHNNFSGESRLPRRQFLPEEGQRFKPEIRDGVEEIITNAIRNYNDGK